MVDPFATRAWVEVIVGLVVLGGAAKSAYNGNIRQFINSVQKIQEIDEKLDHICSRMDEQRETLDNQRDTLIALAWAHEEEDVEIDPVSTEEELGMGPGVRRFLKDDDDFFRGGDND